MTTEQNRAPVHPLVLPKPSRQRPLLREDIIQQLEQFSVEVLQTVLLLLQSQEVDLENGT